ncbi:hypothetical protein N657DRAFT_436431 [Parathielavia appendiculata]|uniref:Protein BNI4 n=1 Tax=Parathielavia appendiculata TaxID=2587402 RepID=A0AAN6U087_9PEZI|nr:hypothetical protein N657DRAFT_436431 [Parathielavia appendiculata]
MAALVQGYPQSGTVTVLQTRPSSASGMLQSVPVQSTTQFKPGGSHRNSIHGLPTTATAPVVYRGGSGLVQQQYTFRNIPSSNQTAQWQQSRTQRTSSSPAVPTMRSLDYLQPAVPHSRYPASMSMTNLPSTANPGMHLGVGTRDDSSLPVPGTKKTATSFRPPQSNNGTSSHSSLAPSAPIRSPPERYRRSALRTDSAGAPSPSTTGSHLRPLHSAMLNRPNSFVGSSSNSAIDDIEFAQASEGVKRVRRRSMPTLDSPGFPIHLTPHNLKQPAEPRSPRSADKDGKVVKIGNHTVPDKTSNDEQTGSGRSAGAKVRPSSSGNRGGNPPNPTANPTMPPSEEAVVVQGSSRSVNVPPRSSSSDGSNPQQSPSPLPRATPVTMESEGESRQATDAADSATQEAVFTPRFGSPAVRQLTEINERRGKPKSKTSRLRRAFSFGSAAELRKAAHDSDTADSGTGKLHKDRKPDEAYDEEQARIAKQQEAAGIGNNIYSGGRFFHGSTDNLSISSTASSASIMIRKMGRGMKKGTRSLVGLFRPKSIVGTSAAEAGPAETTQAEVSMVTVEAERERINVNPDPKAQGGGTGFPRLERNSIDAAKVPALEPERLGSSGTTDSTAARKSFVGGEKERAEVLAAVRKGILKNRSGSSSPSHRPSETKGSAFDPPGVPSSTDSPSSSAPSTPNEESQAHRRAGTVTIGSEDYFVSALRLRQDSNKSSPGTPQGTKRSATFSPRIVFFETWPSQEYDRRGEIATCNRLTPMLAQQIKEELNTFKMEMEVHENSKIYTHFF